MTHETQGKRWPPTAGVEADYITVDTRGAGSAAATRLRLYGIPHSTVYACKPPVLEGWSFSVYSGAEEHASGWGSSSLADMAPALLAAVGMTDAATAHKRAQAAESKVSALASERDAAVEALDVANDMIGKLCTVMASAGFDGDLLSAVGDLIESRNNAIKSRDSKQRELVEVRDALGPSRTADSVSVLAKRVRASLNRWEAVTRELVTGHASNVEDLADRHFDLRLALTGEVKDLRERVETHIGYHVADLDRLSRSAGERITSDRQAHEAEIKEMSANLKQWEALAREHLPAVTLATNTTQRHEDIRTALGEHMATLTTERDAIQRQLDGVKRQLATLVKLSEADDIALRDISRVLGPRRGDESVLSQAERARAILDRWQDLACKFLPACPQLSHAVNGADLGTRHFELRGYLEGEIRDLRDRLSLATKREDQTIAALGHPCTTNGIPAAVKSLREIGDMGWQEAKRADKILSEVRVALETVDGDSIVARALHMRKRSKDLSTVEGLLDSVRYTLETPNDVNILDRATTVLKHVDTLSAEVTRFNEALENTGSYGARERVRCLTAEVTRSRDEATALGKRLDQWVAWGCRAACVVSADDDTLRSEIDKALPMWRRDTPRG